MDSSFFKPESLSLINLFKSAEIFQVPSYQRPYCWRSEEINKLWDDILDAYSIFDESNNTPYFLGSVIVIDKNNGINDIVDGQQRMTTLTILFDALNKMNPELNKGKDSKSNPLLINNKKLGNCISNDNEYCRLRLQSKPSYCSDFEAAIIDVDDFSKYKISSKNDLDTVKNRFINCAAIFYEHINEFISTGNDIGELVNFICNNIFVIKITCSNVSFAIKLFQVLNNRGLELSPADIIKGYLMDEKYLPEEDNDRFTSDWNDIERAAAEFDNDSLTNQFTYYLYYLLGKSPKRTIVEEYEDIIKGKTELGDHELNETKTSVEFIKNLKKFVEEYEDIDDSRDPLLVSFFYLPWKTFWATCLLTAKHRDYNDFNAYAKELRRFLYISYICGYTLNQLKKPLLEVINCAKVNKPMDEIKNICRDFLNEREYTTRLRISLEQKKVFWEAWLKPVLLLINNSLDDAETVNKIPMDSHLHIEHILPRKFSSEKSWEHFKKEDGDAVVNSFGNLTLLGYRKNIKAQNYSFDEKLKIYEGRDGSDKWTCYNITKNVNKFISEGKWDKNSIDKRYEFLVDKLYEILDVDRL